MLAKRPSTLSRNNPFGTEVSSRRVPFRCVESCVDLLASKCGSEDFIISSLLRLIEELEEFHHVSLRCLLTRDLSNANSWPWYRMTRDCGLQAEVSGRAAMIYLSVQAVVKL